MADAAAPLAASRPSISRATRVAEGVARIIIDGGLQPGDSLPSEGELSERFGVSKPVVREGLSQLVGLGLVEPRRGSAATVKRLTGEPLRAYFSIAVRQEASGLRQAFELRRVLEEHVVGIAARQVTDEGVNRLRRCVGHLYVTRDLDAEWAEADVEFHRIILSIARNPTMGRILEALDGAVGETVRGVRSFHHPVDTMGSFRRHEAIFEALAARDPDAARQAMRVHFDAMEAAIDSVSRRFHAANATATGDTDATFSTTGD